MKLYITLFALISTLAVGTCTNAQTANTLYQMSDSVGDYVWSSDNLTNAPYSHTSREQQGFVDFNSELTLDPKSDNASTNKLMPIIAFSSPDKLQMYLTIDQSDATNFQVSNPTWTQLSQTIGFARKNTKKNYIPIHESTNAITTSTGAIITQYAFGDQAHATRMPPGWKDQGIKFYIFHDQTVRSSNLLNSVGTFYQDVDSPYYIATSPWATPNNTGYTQAALLTDGYTCYGNNNGIDQTNQGGESQLVVLQDQTGNFSYDTVICLLNSAEYTTFHTTDGYTQEVTIGWAFASSTANYTEVFEYKNSSTKQHQYVTSSPGGLWTATGAAFWIAT